jgi:hypothetical protein
MEKLKVKSYAMTCAACPSQWDVYTEDDQYIYVRYRWGHFTAELGGPFNELLFGWYSDDEWDGSMSSEKMIELLSEILDFSTVKTV